MIGIITLGIGPDGNIPHFITLGLDIGEAWVEVPPTSGIWTDVTDPTDIWTEVTPTAGTWTDV